MDWIIGDIHGQATALAALLDAVDARDPEARFHFVGDYCDRGPATHGVVEQLLALEGRAACVRGNHDEIFDVALNAQGFSSGPHFGGPVGDDVRYEASAMFLREGLIDTFASYNADATALLDLVGRPAAFLDQLDALCDLVPPHHKTFFRDLPAAHETDRFVVVHATWPPDAYDEPGLLGRLADDPILRHDVLWDRYAASQVRADKRWTRTVYVGHTPTHTYAKPTGGGLLARRRPEPPLVDGVGQVVFGNKLVLCDTGAFLPGGRLSAVCHDTREVLQTDAAGEVF